MPPRLPKPLVRTPFVCAVTYFQKGFLDGECSVLNQTGPTAVSNLKMPLMRREGRGQGFHSRRNLEADFFNVIKANCCDRGVEGKGLVSDCWQGCLGSGEMWMVQAAYSLQLLTLNVSTEGEI